MVVNIIHNFVLHFMWWNLVTENIDMSEWNGSVCFNSFWSRCWTKERTQRNIWRIQENGLYICLLSDIQVYIVCNYYSTDQLQWTVLDTIVKTLSYCCDTGCHLSFVNSVIIITKTCAHFLHNLNWLSQPRHRQAITPWSMSQTYQATILLPISNVVNLDNFSPARAPENLQ